MDCGFVILHYKAFDMTTLCVNTIIEKFNATEYHVVIVDNGSKDGSGERLRDKYSRNNHVEVIINEENLGFANGNNVGYRYIKENVHPNFIVIMNNDVVINDEKFIDIIKLIYKKSLFDVLGPDIYNPNNSHHQNPIRLNGRNYEEVKKRYKAFLMRCMYPSVFYILACIKKMFERKEQMQRECCYLESHINPLLHGACLILSSGFFQKMDYCFNNKTFLYHEEDIFYNECIKRNMIMIYSPEIVVEHYEDVSTNESFTSEYQKYKTRNKWLRDSCKILMDILEKQKLCK